MDHSVQKGIPRPDDDIRRDIRTGYKTSCLRRQQRVCSGATIEGRRDRQASDNAPQTMDGDKNLAETMNGSRLRTLVRCLLRTGGRCCRHKPLVDNTPPSERCTSAHKWIRGVKRSDVIERHVTQHIGRDAENLSQLTKGIDGNVADIAGAQRLPGHGGFPLERPADAIV